jgi:hypothetical protein
MTEVPKSRVILTPDNIHTHVEKYEEAFAKVFPGNAEFLNGEYKTFEPAGNQADLSSFLLQEKRKYEELKAQAYQYILGSLDTTSLQSITSHETYQELRRNANDPRGLFKVVLEVLPKIKGGSAKFIVDLVENLIQKMNKKHTISEHLGIFVEKIRALERLGLVGEEWKCALFLRTIDQNRYSELFKWVNRREIKELTFERIREKALKIGEPIRDKPELDEDANHQMTEGQNMINMNVSTNLSGEVTKKDSKKKGKKRVRFETSSEPNPKSDNKGKQCGHCGKNGHVEEECYQKHPHLRKKQRPAHLHFTAERLSNKMIYMMNGVSPRIAKILENLKGKDLLNADMFILDNGANISAFNRFAKLFNI